MTHHTVRRQDRDGLAKFLGWFSVALGTTQLAAPRALTRLVGAEDGGLAPLVMRAMGAREVAQGLGILIRPRPTGFLFSRVAGDALDLGLLGLVGVKNRRLRTLFAIANVLPIAVADVYESRHLAAKDGPPQSGKRIRKAVTINKPRAEVERAWKASGSKHEATFAAAPGGRGTELAVEFVQDPPFGELGVVATKLAGTDKATQLSDELRRFKQEVETGEVVRSDATPAGHDRSNHLKQRAAQPLEEAVR
jgi:uncharacterized membrane protein